MMFQNQNTIISGLWFYIYTPIKTYYGFKYMQTHFLHNIHCLTNVPRLNGREWVPTHPSYQLNLGFFFFNTIALFFILGQGQQSLTKCKLVFFRWFKFTLKPPYSIACGELRLAIRDTFFWTFWLKFGHKGP